MPGLRVIAFNSSPRMENGATDLVLKPLLDGMREAGADVELVYLHRLDIRPCRGCFACWLKTPGVCVQDDGMTDLLPRIARSDVVVYATPLYVDGMTAPMKMLLDRSIPLLQPFITVHDDHCRHDRREGYRDGRVVLVSVSGFTEIDNFDPLVAHVRAACRNMRREFAGALLRPYAASLPDLAAGGVDVEDVYAAAHEAGGRIVRDGAIPEDIQARVSRELIPRERYVRAANVMFRQELRRHGLGDRAPGDDPA